MSLLENFVQYIKKENLFQSADKLLIAVSGGLDSVVLCNLCRQAKYDFAIAHCNFKLRGDFSDSDALFVQALAKELNVPYFTTSFDTIAVAKESKKGLEETARDLRYDWFNTIAAQNNYTKILTAHHADDNIETVAMNFFRGTGIKGLRGILPKNGAVIRPLLFARRAALEGFAKSNNIGFVTDHTNAENDYTRNNFRNTILPLVNKNFPEAGENILKNIQRFTEVEILYRQSIDLHLKKLLVVKGNEVHIPILKLQKTKPLATVFFEIIKDYGFTAHQTQEALNLLDSETGKYIQSNSYRIIKNRNWLIIAPVESEQAINILVEEKDKKITFESGVLQLEHFNKDAVVIANDASIAMLDADVIKFPLLLRKWKQGDYFYPLGMAKKKKLGRFLNDLKLSITQKENIWVIEMDKKIIWITGKRIDDRFKIKPSTKAILKLTYLPK